jgi:hypothetical protein
MRLSFPPIASPSSVNGRSRLGNSGCHVYAASWTPTESRAAAIAERAPPRRQRHQFVVSCTRARCTLGSMAKSAMAGDHAVVQSLRTRQHPSAVGPLRRPMESPAATHPRHGTPRTVAGPAAGRRRSAREAPGSFDPLALDPYSPMIRERDPSAPAGSHPLSLDPYSP